MIRQMATIISLFNHKGGVSKTTSTFHIGWKLAQMGKKVLMVDADPQCNLTGLALGINDYDSLFAFYDSRKNDNIYDCLAHLFGMGKPINGNYADPTLINQAGNNLFLLAGKIEFAKLDLQISGAILSSSSYPVMRQLVGSIYNLIYETIKEHEFDIVLIDMSPSLGGVNQSIFMSSDYIIIPSSPDFFCYQAIDSMTKFLPEWANGDIAKFKDGKILPKENPKVMGMLLSNYRVYTTDEQATEKRMAKSFQHWFDKIQAIFRDEMVRKLEPLGMVIDKPILSTIKDFNSLIPKSQELSKPMFALNPNDCGWSGVVADQKQADINECNKIYQNLAEDIIKLI